MENVPEFVLRFEKEAQALLKEGVVKLVLFSRGAYQFEVKRKKETDYPFLTLSDTGVLGDAFCTCKVSEGGSGCPHLAASYLQVGGREPLHVRFSKSFWYHLFLSCSKRWGDKVKKKELFWMEGLDRFVEKRPKETEETSIKFFNLSADEMAKYRAGKPSQELRFELSFWSDLAKWLMSQTPEISFEGEGIPEAVVITLPKAKIWISMKKEDWIDVIPSLATVKSPLQVFDRDLGIERVDVTPEGLTIHRRKISEKEVNAEGEVVGDWLFVKKKGFYRKSLETSGAIPKEQVPDILPSLDAYLTIHPDPVTPHYKLWFDSESSLHIDLYVKEVGDVKAVFGQYVYTGEFYRLTEMPFEQSLVKKEDVPEFINRHRLWLNGFPGFQPHLGSLEAHLTYYLEDALVFEAELNFPEQFEERIDFQEWVYVKGSGFYMKRQGRGRLPLHPGLTVKKDEISSFISNHKDELEDVQGFFSGPMIQRMGLIVNLNEYAEISIQPKIEFVPGIEEVEFFGDYVYAKGKGFAEVPMGSRLPERFRVESTIPRSQESAFLAYELEPLRPFILELDARLQKPVNLQLNIRKIQRDRRKPGEWLVDLMYESESGSIDIFSIYDAFSERKKHLFTPAGLIFLKEARFNWLRGIPKRRLDRKRGMLKMSTLEWIRLSVFEQIQEPRGADKESQETRKLLEELQRFETHRPLNISHLKAQLRPYQETGLQWLWFLYSHGLSGLLCDDMGLGKTHQTMALLAAIVNEDPERGNKYLVVCPTSVMYHWQELLKKFLPELRVYTYYGLSRTLDQFEEEYDLLLTSYGILRTGRDDLRVHRFECAIFDEIQVAKNATSQTHLALKGISARMRLGLSGTPIENRVRELKSLLDIVLPGYMPTDSVFRELFITPIEKEQDEEKKRLLSKLVKPFILRRKKSEVLSDLPEKIEEIAYCDLSSEQKSLYAATAQKLRGTIFRDLKDKSKPVSYVHVFSALSELKQICDHPSLLTGDIKKYKEHESGKWDLFVELLSEARDSGQKVVIFSQYLDMLAIIEQYLKKHEIGFATIKGSTRDRAEQLRKFRQDPTCEVFTASLLAAGVGIDLTVASIVIHYDRWWNPAKENQATDRVHRIGQNRGVQVFKLVTKHTIEEHIHELIEKKKGLMEEIIGDTDDVTIQRLSREELLQIFEKIFSETE